MLIGFRLSHSHKAGLQGLGFRAKDAEIGFDKPGLADESAGDTSFKHRINSQQAL